MPPRFLEFYSSHSIGSCCGQSLRACRERTKVSYCCCLFISSLSTTNNNNKLASKRDCSIIIQNWPQIKLIAETRPRVLFCYVLLSTSAIDLRLNLVIRNIHAKAAACCCYNQNHNRLPEPSSRRAPVKLARFPSALACSKHSQGHCDQSISLSSGPFQPLFNPLAGPSTKLSPNCSRSHLDCKKNIEFAFSCSTFWF